MTETTSKSDKQLPTFAIVGIGASAGGLEAFEQFFHHVSADSGFAYVLVPHLDPSHSSLLSDILQRSTTMKVIEALDQIKVEPNCVYIIPPNREMAIFHGVLQLTLPEQPRGQRMPIDAFLRSLAEDQQENAIGIILSGTGTDGTLGLRAILGAGGLTLVQKPDTAKYDGMPVSAIHAGYATHVLPVENMPEVLMKGIRSYTAHAQKPLPPKTATGINSILMHLRSQTGHDFSLYKKSTISRRIERRMIQHGIEDTATYVRYLKENSAEVHQLFKELLINVTSFFRDAEAFEVLQNEILPALCKERDGNYVFRVWVAGCATGEEAYSIAILLREFMDEHNLAFKVQIYSTDLDDDAIAIARAGSYPPNIAQDVSPKRIQRYFIKEDNVFRVKKDIREMVVFAIQNAIKDPPFTKLDLLSCRNLMIYLEPELQDRLIRSFHYALKPAGILFLSPSESIGNHTDLFSSVNRKWKFYSATHPVTTTREALTPGLSWSVDNIARAPESIVKPKEINLNELTHKILLQQFAPAAVLCDLKGTILYIHGETGKYLRPAPGQASLNIMDMARQGLDLELRSALKAAASGGTPTSGRGIKVKTNGGFSSVSLSVNLIPDLVGGQRLLLISFQDIAGTAAPKKRKPVSMPDELSRVTELEHDLIYLKESNQAIIEEQQASNEELKSANEEMQSTNEELQSTNEELETSKEELQSVNEELITVNSELQSKIEQLISMQNDMKNLLDNISVGIVFLDRKLQIRSFTRDALRVYRLVLSDIGRPIADIRSVFSDEELLTAAQGVLNTLVPYEKELPIGDNNWILVRIQPYRTLDDMIDGVVLTFTDITSRIKAIETQNALTLAESIVNTIREPFIVLDGNLNVINCSKPFYEAFKLTAEQTMGQNFFEFSNRLWDIDEMRTKLDAILLRDVAFEEVKLIHDFPAIGQLTVLLNIRRIVGRINEPQMILLSIEIVK
jgi:two-component system, chemotaxis family, CheB/CheR fusion protein